MADDTLVVTGQVFKQVPTDDLLVTPTGGVQTRLADALATATGGAVAATTLTASGAVTLNPANANVSIAPTGSGTHAVNNMTIGVTTPAAGKFTTAAVTSDNGIVLTGQTSDAGATTGTLTNSPTVGNPTFWLRISVNGTNVAIPAWPAV